MLTIDPKPNRLEARFRRPVLEAILNQSTVEPVVFNHETALSRMGGMKELLFEVLAIMADECPALRAGLQSAIESGDAAEAHRFAHSLKNQTSNLGAIDLADRFLKVENAAANGHFEVVLAELSELDRQFTRFLERIDHEIESAEL